MDKELKMRNAVFLLCITTILSCHKTDYSNVMFSNNVDDLLKLNNYDNINKFKINDSITKYSAQKNQFKLTGDYNEIFKHKAGWWTITDTVSNEKQLSVEIIMEGKSERKSQVLIFKNGEIDTAKSKFYNFELTYNKNSPDKVIYHFYTSKSNFSTKETTFTYAIFESNQMITNTQVNCKKIQNNHHYYEIDVRNFNFHANYFIAGIFSQYSFNTKNKEMGISEIFVQDSIKMKK